MTPLKWTRNFSLKNMEVEKKLLEIYWMHFECLFVCHANHSHIDIIFGRVEPSPTFDIWIQSPFVKYVYNFSAQYANIYVKPLFSNRLLVYTLWYTNIQ